MLSFKQYLDEAIVHNGIHAEIKKDRIDFHYGGKLVHSRKGDYSNPTKTDHNTAKSIATRVHLSVKNKPGGYTLNYGKI
jgi:hypothetical protein